MFNSHGRAGSVIQLEIECENDCSGQIAFILRSCSTLSPPSYRRA